MRYRHLMVRLGIGFGLILSASVFAANADQAAINTLQQQIQESNQQWHQALQAQQVANQKATSDLQKQVQVQISTIQKQMQQMQVQLTKEIQQVQAEVVKVNSASTPAPAPKSPK